MATETTELFSLPLGSKIDLPWSSQASLGRESLGGEILVEE